MKKDIQFFLNIRKTVESLNLEISATIFDYDSVEEYLKYENEKKEYYFSVNSKDTFYSLAFKLDMKSEQLWLIYNFEGFNSNIIGRPKNINIKDFDLKFKELLSNLLL